MCKYSYFAHTVSEAILNINIRLVTRALGELRSLKEDLTCLKESVVSLNDSVVGLNDSVRSLHEQLTEHKEQTATTDTITQQMNTKLNTLISDLSQHQRQTSRPPRLRPRPSMKMWGFRVAVVCIMDITNIIFLHTSTVWLLKLCCAAGAEIAVELNPVYGFGSDASYSEAISTQPNPVYGLSEDGTSHEVDPATTASATDEHDDVISNPISD